GLVVVVAERDEGEEDGGVGLRGFGEGLGGGGLRVRGAVRLEDHQGGGLRVGGVRVVVGQYGFHGGVVAGTAHAAEAGVGVVDGRLGRGRGEVGGAVDLRGEEDDVDGGVLAAGGVEVLGEGEGLV